MTEFMHRFNSGGVDIAYLDEGAGDVVILIHGFASNASTNWVFTGWMKVLHEAGYRVIALDNRGHGASEKLYDSALYGASIMAEDVRRLMDHLNITSAYVIGYSMGARIAATLCLAHPQRIKAAIFAGLAMGMVEGLSATQEIGDALSADDPASITNPDALAFRTFAEQTKSDRLALAACIRESRSTIAAGQLAKIKLPVLAVAGDKDDIAGDLESFVNLFPHAEACELTGRDHMSAVGDKKFKAAALDFFARHC